MAAVGIALLVIPQIAFACEPCPIDMMLDLDGTAAQADLIIVGQLVGEGPDMDTGPDWISVRVIELWKGSAPDEPIQVNSWDGMCAYGIIMEGETLHLIFLEDKGEQYDAVNYGCGVHSLPIVDGQVTVEEQSYTPGEMAERLGLEDQRHTVNEPLANPLAASRLPLNVVVLALGAGLCGASILGITLAVLLIVRRRRQTA
jgi:hypothetical protein